MIKKLTQIAIFAVVCTVSAFAAENNAVSLKAELKDMAKQLESENAAEIKAFILKYALPDEVKNMLQEDKLEMLVENFMKRKKKVLHDCLLAASVMEPKVGDDKATYTFSPEDDTSKKLERKLVLKYSEKTKLFQIKN